MTRQPVSSRIVVMVRRPSELLLTELAEDWPLRELAWTETEDDARPWLEALAEACPPWLLVEPGCAGVTISLPSAARSTRLQSGGTSMRAAAGLAIAAAMAAQDVQDMAFTRKGSAATLRDRGAANYRRGVVVEVPAVELP